MIKFALPDVDWPLDEEDRKYRLEYGVSPTDVYDLDHFLVIVLINALELFFKESEIIEGAEGENCEDYFEEVARHQCEVYRDLRRAHSLLLRYYESIWDHTRRETPIYSEMALEAFHLIGKHLGELWL